MSHFQEVGTVTRRLCYVKEKAYVLHGKGRW